MFKKDLVNAIASKTGNTKASAELFLGTVIDTIIETLRHGNDVNLIGFGSFKVIQTKEKVGRNPRTGMEIKIPAGKKIKFVVGKILKDSVCNPS